MLLNLNFNAEKTLALSFNQMDLTPDVINWSRAATDQARILCKDLPHQQHEVAEFVEQVP